ncbi:MAG: cyclic nucleotide-binding domain-containing protein, partial [Cyanobacteria bacterium P01_C01_bin.70]
AAAFFDNVLGTKHVILSSLENGLIELEDPSAQGQLYLNLLHSQEHLAWVQIGFANGDFLGAQRREDGLYHLDKRQWGDRLGELGEPGSALAVAQAEREEQAQVYAQTGELSELLGKPDWQVETYQFSPEDRTLTQVDSNRRHEFYYAPLRPYYQEALENLGETVWTDVYRFRTGNVVGLDAATAYRDPETGVLRGVISISIGLRQISEYLADIRSPSKGLLFILDRQGNLVAASNPSILATTFESTGGAELPTMDRVDNPLLQVVDQTFEENNIGLSDLVDIQEFSQYDSVTNERYYIAVSPLGRLDWTIGSITPEDVYLSSVNQNHRRLLVLILGLLSGSLVVLWSINDRLLIRPIMSITDAAAAMEEGKFHHAALRKTAQREDELGHLAEIFQNMAEVIGDREKSLKAQIADLRDSGTGMAGSQLEMAYYNALLERAAQRPSPLPETGQFPPSGSLSAYYRILKERAESVRSTRISGAEVERLLRIENYLASLPDGDLRELASSAQREVFDAKALIFQEGDGAQKVYVIALGTVELLSTSQDGPIRTLRTGQLLGDLNLMLNIPYTTSARSREDTVLFAFDSDTFSRILRQNPQVIPAVEPRLISYQDTLIDAQIWIGEEHPQLAAGATWLEMLVQQLHHWWHGQLIEH